MIERTGSEVFESRVPTGTRLNGIYEIDEAIASGGMGDVYKGHEIHTGDSVAIKILRMELADNEAALALFRKEASALHNLYHEAIVRYFVCSVDPNLRRPYLAMEFVEGAPLSQLLKREPLTFEAVRTLARRLALGLDAAHARGIIHRDVTPDNIIIPGGDVGRAKIIDFGIARSTLFGEGTIIGGGFAGKYNYVSPEQLGLYGGDVTARSDIYSLGLTLVEALTGRPIDMSGTQVQVIEKRRKLPDLGGIDMRIRPLLEKMLQPDPANRPESMQVVADWCNVGPTASSREPTSPPRPAIYASEDGGGAKPQNRWWLIGAAAAAAIVLIGGGVAYFLLSPKAPQTSASTAPQTTAPRLGNEAKPPTLGAPAVQKPAAPIDEAAQIAKLKSFIANYNGGDCFFVTPISLGAKTAKLEGYGLTTNPFEALDRAFTQAAGFDADIGLRQVVPAQCPAVSFLGQLRDQAANAPTLEINSTDLRSGQNLTGTVAGFGGRHVDLLLISDDGSVYNLSPLLKDSADRKIFNLRMQLTNAAQAEPQILIAVATTTPLTALAINQPVPAATLFPAALAEAARTGQTISASAKYFKLQ